MPNDLNEAIESGTQKKLKGGDYINTKLCARVITGKTEIKSINVDGSIK